MAFVTPVVEHWLEREIAQWVHPMKDRSDDPPHHERTLYLWATSRSPISGAYKDSYDVDSFSVHQVFKYNYFIVTSLVVTEILGSISGLYFSLMFKCLNIINEHGYSRLRHKEYVNWFISS